MGVDSVRREGLRARRAVGVEAEDAKLRATLRPPPWKEDGESLLQRRAKPKAPAATVYLPAGCSEVYLLPRDATRAP